uniref:MyTH4 domain-containing protein n=1 Tax=Heterorhabditis bacteriophora TaxID=37862 RepID=A0A1I7WYG8_HETBA
MRFMGDEPIRRGETMTDTIYRLLLICHKNAVLRDEVYCQIIRQTTHNKSTKVDSTVRGWRLFLILTAYFECSLALRPYLLNYLTENADDPRRIYHGTAQLCLQNLAQTMRYGGRKYLLSGMEVEEITNGKILKRQVYMLPGGHKKIINTKSITVVEEIIMELCKEINIRSPSEQQEFCLCYVLEKENSVQCCSNDEYILDICTELEHKKLKFYFLLKRMVWVLPLRLDNPVYIDAMFFQIVIDYLQGSFVCLQGGNQLSATMTDDICRLAAFLHLASNEERKQFVSGRSIMSLIPTVVLDARIMPVDSWTERINHKLMTIDNNITSTQARATFLGQPLPPIELSIGKSGIRLLSPISHRIINEWNFDKIISTKTDGVRNSTAIMTVGTTKSSRTFEFRTSDVGTYQNFCFKNLLSQASEIVRLVGQYTYVVRESKGLLEQ